MDVEDTQVEVNETQREVETAEQMLKKMEEPHVVFLDFKEDKKKRLGFGAVKRLGFGAVVVNKRTLSPITEFGFCIRSTLKEEYYNFFYYMTHQKVLIGHDLLTDWKRLESECHGIGKPPPEPKLFIDTAPFIKPERLLAFFEHMLMRDEHFELEIFMKKHTQLAKLVVLFGLGKATRSSSANCHLNINAIKKCEAAMSILDIGEKEKYSAPTLHPVIRHLVKFQDHIGRKEAICIWKEEFFEFLAEPKTSQDVEWVSEKNEASMEMLKKEPSVVIVVFKEDDFGMMCFGGSVVCSKTLSPYSSATSFRIQATARNGKPTSKTPDEFKHEPTLEEYYSRVYNMLDQKVWIGHGLLESDWPMLQDEFAHIGKEPPRPKIIIDTAPFIRSQTKLARLAVLLGLDKAPGGSYHSYCVFLKSIKECGEAMSILDMEMEQPEIHPMISHLTKFQQSS